MKDVFLLKSNVQMEKYGTQVYMPVNVLLEHIQASALVSLSLFAQMVWSITL